MIDVGYENQQEVRLWQTDGYDLGYWIALSYCWGQDPDTMPLRTTTLNIADHCKGIAIVNLPKTFRDAVTVTRKLGYRFLWIDSICIIQDSEHDWKFESQNMIYVHSNSALTISAEASRHAHDGLFVTRDIREQLSSLARSKTDTYKTWLKSFDDIENYYDETDKYSHTDWMDACLREVSASLKLQVRALPPFHDSVLYLHKYRMAGLGRVRCRKEVGPSKKHISLIADCRIPIVA